MLLLERAPEDEAGGNSRFTAGLLRIVYNGAEDLGQLIDLSKEEIERTDFGTYTAEQFLDDMARVTEYRCDPDLTEVLIGNSFEAGLWLRKHGVRYTIEWYVSGEPFYTAPGALSDAVGTAIQQVTGMRPKLSTGGGTSDGRFIAPLGAQVVELGVVNATIHKVNESVQVEEIDQLHRMYFNVLRNLLT